MACFRLFISVALAMFGVCVRCVYGIEEYAVAEYAADFVDLPASVTHLSYDSVITPRDRAESCDDVLNMSSTNEVSFLASFIYTFDRLYHRRFTLQYLGPGHVL